MIIQPRPEIAALLHSRRFTRFLCLTRDVPRVKGFCAWCGSEKLNGLKYCGNDCRLEANVRASGIMVEYEVFRRDKGICAACGMDCEWVASQKRIMGKVAKYDYPTRALHGSWGPWATHDRLWQADHIVPVVEGGGVCGLENYRTLCLRCHKADTAELARRIAVRKREGGR